MNRRDTPRTSSASATAPKNSTGSDMSDLFDLPFEEQPDDVADGRSGDRRSQEPPPSRRLLTVTEVTLRVRDLLEAEFVEVWIEGELSNCRLWSGHLYFTLKDSSTQLRAFMFRSALR